MIPTEQAPITARLTREAAWYRAKAQAPLLGRCEVTTHEARDTAALLEECAVRLAPQLNRLQHELLDLIKLMPDSQVDDMLAFVAELRAARRAR